MHGNRRGADIDAEDMAGNSPAHLAAARGHMLLLSALLQVCTNEAVAALWQRCVQLALVHAVAARLCIIKCQ